MKSHLKRLTIPTTWPIAKKSNVYITRPFPSRSYEQSMPLSTIFRDVLGFANTAKEVKHLLLNNYIFVDGTRRTDIKSSMGLMDVLEIKGTNESYRFIINTKGKLVLVPIKEAEAKIRPSKVIGKKILKGNKIQLNLLGGYNCLVEKDECKIGDSVVLSMPEKKVSKVLPLKEGASVYLIAGSHIGAHGKVISFENNDIIVKVGTNEIRTTKDYAYVIGEDKPIITLSVD